jgi:hypothetical protein
MFEQAFRNIDDVLRRKIKTWNWNSAVSAMG